MTDDAARRSELSDNLTTAYAAVVDAVKTVNDAFAVLNMACTEFDRASDTANDYVEATFGRLEGATDRYYTDSDFDDVVQAWEDAYAVFSGILVCCEESQSTMIEARLADDRTPYTTTIYDDTFAEELKTFIELPSPDNALTALLATGREKPTRS